MDFVLAVMGLCIGFMWASLLARDPVFNLSGGYRKAVEDSFAPGKSKRWHETLKKIEERRAQAAAASSPK